MFNCLMDKLTYRACIEPNTDDSGLNLKKKTVAFEEQEADE